MKQRDVVTTPEANEDARLIDEWWTTHRDAAPNLFLEELADALALLGMEPGVGARFHSSMRRSLPAETYACQN